MAYGAFAGMSVGHSENCLCGSGNKCGAKFVHVIALMCSDPFVCACVEKFVCAASVFACAFVCAVAPLLVFRTLCMKTLSDAFLTRGSSITSDVEMSVRHFAKFGPLALWPQLLVQKPNPGSYCAGKGGNSSLFKDEQSFTNNKRKAIGELAAEFPGFIKLLDKPTGKNNWKHFEFVKQDEPSEVAAPAPASVCEHCVWLAERLERAELKLKNADHVVQLMIERDRTRLEGESRVSDVRTPPPR